MRIITKSGLNEIIEARFREAEGIMIKLFGRDCFSRYDSQLAVMNGQRVRFVFSLKEPSATVESPGFMGDAIRFAEEYELKRKKHGEEVTISQNY